jgi:cytoskeleton-associated protein 5
VSKALDTYVMVVPLERMLPAVTACSVDAKFPADGRRDAMAWLAASAHHGAANCDFGSAFAAAATGLVDKSSEVREAAALLATSLATAAGVDATARSLRALPKPAQAALTERLGAMLAQAPAAAEAAMPSMDAVAYASRPLTAPATSSSARAGGSAAPRGGRPPSAASGTIARAGSLASAGGPLLVLSPPERKEERLMKLPRKPLASVSGKDFAAEVRDSSAEELTVAATAYLRDDLRARMLCEDFKKHIEAAEVLEGALSGQLEEVISVLDLLFRWAVLRLCEVAPNTSSLLRVLDWLNALFDALRGAGYRLREEEAVLLLPVVLEKSGHNLPAVRERFRRLMRAACGLHPVSKVVALLGTGLGSKNTRSRVECLEELAAIIERHGIEVAERAGARVLPSVVPLSAERDATLRKSALEVLSGAYRVAGDGVWRHLGKLSDLQRETLEAHFRKAARDMAARGERPGSVAGHVALDEGAPARPAQQQRPATAAAAPSGFIRSPSRAGSAAGGAGVSPVMRSTSFGSSGSREGTPTASSGTATLGASDADWTAALVTLTGQDEPAAVGAMKVICACLKDLIAGQQSEDTVALFAADADRLVSMLTTQVAKMFEAAASAAVQPAPSRACKYALNALMQTFSSVRMARAVAEPTVRSAVGELLLRLLDERVPRIEEGGQLVRALNLLMLKVLENANRTSTFVALLLMLRKPPASLVAGDVERRVRFSDLVVKCLIKLTRTLGASLAGLDVSEVLLTIHSFFMVLGVEEIRRRGAEDDRPLRMVKTVLYELTKVLGPGISTHLTKVPPASFEPSPIIYAYIDLNLQSLAASGVVAPGGEPSSMGGLQTLESADGGDFGGSGGSAAAAAAARAVAAPPPSPPPPSPSGASRLASHDLKTQLAGIFRKIGDKVTTAEGIEELYSFKQAQPGIDITPHLAKTSDAFQLYIQRGLAKVEAAHTAGGEQPPLARSTSGGALPSADASSASAASVAPQQSAVEAYQERLQRVKAAHAAGLSSSAAFSAGALLPPTGAAASEQQPGAASAAPAPAGSRQNLDALRERMRTIAAKAGTDPGAPSASLARPATAPAASAGGPPLAEAPVRASDPPTTTASALRSSTVSLSELQARMARIRELSSQSQPPAAAPPPSEG